jgi:hypothetical protein
MLANVGNPAHSSAGARFAQHWPKVTTKSAMMDTSALPEPRDDDCYSINTGFLSKRVTACPVTLQRSLRSVWPLASISFSSVNERLPCTKRNLSFHWRCSFLLVGFFFAKLLQPNWSPWPLFIVGSSSCSLPVVASNGCYDTADKMTAPHLVFH